MKTIIAIFVSSLILFTTEAQEFKHFKVGNVFSSVRISLFPLDKVSPLDLDSTDWGMTWLPPSSYPGDMKAAEIERFKHLFSNLSHETQESLRSVNFMFYIGKDFRITTYTIYIDKKLLNKQTEQLLYDFANAHSDMSYIKPFVKIPKDFKGSLYNVYLTWFLK